MTQVQILSLKASQFHYGSITTNQVYKLQKTGKESQFHYGSITTILSKKLYLRSLRVSIPLWFDYNIVRQKSNIIMRLMSLNSTMVRLQLNMKSLKYGFTLDSSQFHYGSITTQKQRQLLCIKFYRLNSTMVRLQPVIKSISIEKLRRLGSQFHYGSITTNISN